MLPEPVRLDEITSVKRLRTEEGSSTQDQEEAAGEAAAKSGEDGVEEAEEWSGQLGRTAERPRGMRTEDG